ncbi:TIGR01777 family protein [Vibrio albus]|uniref:TIGR01777 family protein n=1 Tax=Vibrio albus TaxID=2200953 RepID=A0A2U3BC95_9VIBR|nr:TIGR01777 family oxidoreductase [Vibrio albus]PWI34412.1 TIGR01777 family protein [Vibrio albus]
MRILLTGGTGFIGSELVKQLMTHDIVLLTRNVTKARQILNHASQAHLTYIDSLDRLSDLNHIDAVINLAGEPIAGKRWSKRQKQKICDSRWNITRKITELIYASTEPPSVFISGSAVGYYGDQQEHPFDESLHVCHEEFTHHVCARWEELAMRAQSEDTRVCILRTGVVLGLNGGALKMMLPAYKFGAGAVLGSGRQYMPWIHIQDMVRGISYLLNTEHASGYFNLTAPHPVQNREFSRILAKNLKRPYLPFTPRWALALLMGEASSLLFDSIRAKPKHLTDLGFHFNYSRLEPAIKNLLHHYK